MEPGLLMFFSGFFVEAGAFDGASESTSLHFEIAHQWSGLLIEPVSRLRLVMMMMMMMMIDMMMIANQSVWTSH